MDKRMPSLHELDSPTKKTEKGTPKQSQKKIDGEAAPLIGISKFQMVNRETIKKIQ